MLWSNIPLFDYFFFIFLNVSKDHFKVTMYKKTKVTSIMCKLGSSLPLDNKF
jgi:hypothetical protein